MVPRLSPQLSLLRRPISSPLQHNQAIILSSSSSSSSSFSVGRAKPYPAAARRTLIPAPTPNSGPLLSRRSDRALPDVSSSQSATRRTLRAWRHAPLFLLLVGGGALALLNHQKVGSSVVGSCLYALRVNPRARERLGDEVYFAHRMPYVWGSIDQVHGNVDISFKVKGSRSVAMMRYHCVRKNKNAYFETVEWSLTFDNGEVINLLDSNATDPIVRSDLPTTDSISSLDSGSLIREKT